MKTTGKKGDMFFNVFFLAVMVFVLLILLVTVYTKTDKLTKDFGNIQINMLATYQEAEKALFFIDQAAKYSAEKAAYDLGQKGGHSERSNCGSYFGYTIWNNDFENAGEDCYPNVKQEFTVLFDNNLNEYLRKYPSTTIHLNNHDYLVKNENAKTIIYGFAARNLNFDIKEIEKEEREIIEIPLISFEDIETKPGVMFSNLYYGKLVYRRRHKDVNRIILHHTGDSEASKTFRTLRKRGLSVHYIVDRDGTIYYAVDEKWLAYHAIGYNEGSIGIEIVNTGKADMQYTNEQYNSINALGRDIARRWPSIEWDNEHVIGHYQATTPEAGKWDPSPNFNWARIGLGGHILLADLGRSPDPDAGYA